MNSIYLDHNATTPISNEVVAAMRPYLEDYFGNPSSTHAYGIKAKQAVEKARKQLAELIGCQPTEIIFTSGGTESNNYAIKGSALANRERGNHIITSSIEHPAVYEVCLFLQKQGFEITFLPVTAEGIIDPDELERAIKPSTILITLMHANNETGVIQPVEEFSRIARKHKIILHTDAAQSVGKIPVNVHQLGVDLLTVAGHKLYAPKGIGALFIKAGTRLEKLIHGADHEQNLRAGTENVPEIVGLGKASEIASRDLEFSMNHNRSLRDLMHSLIVSELPEIRLNGHKEKRLPNTLSLSFRNVEANTLVSRLENVAVSAGAACHSESIDVSAVLEAMHVPIDFAMGTIRFSIGKNNTEEEIHIAAKEVIRIVKSLRPDNGASDPADDGKDNIKLTQYTHGLGCACKIEPASLEKILSSLEIFKDENILVGTETSDDAAVYKISEEKAIVQTLDFFTPIVDDPYEFGSIAATNAFSDIYAMGAVPLFAMNIVGFPENTLPLSVLKEILKGAQDKAEEAGVAVVGGHTIEDPEPKYGMVVTGEVHPGKIWKNTGAQPGDALILTKPLGTGIISTGIKRGMVTEATKRTATMHMSELNKLAADTLKKYEIHACTDVTGFGLLGHLLEMSSSSGCNVEVYYANVPFLPEVEDLATAGIIPGGTYNNLSYVAEKVNFNHFSRTRQLMLCDAQTSGGLLAAVPSQQAEQIIDALKSSGIMQASMIGLFEKSRKGNILIK